MRGHYAAIQVWFGIVLVVGELGQTAATTYFVARDPDRAPDYLATSRRMMVVSGATTLTIGLLITPLLARGDPTVAGAYRIMFATCLIAFVGASYTFALQAVKLPLWNIVRLSQPALFLTAVAALHLVGSVDLTTTSLALSATVATQTAIAYRFCVANKLHGGTATAELRTGMRRYGLSQLSAVAPTVVSARLDQLALSMTVAPALLGQYAVATSLTALAAPATTAIGCVAFPRLASSLLTRRQKQRIQKRALLSCAALSTALMLALAISAPWLIATLYGDSYHGSLTAIFILAPGGIALACNQVSSDLLRGYGMPLQVAKAQWAGALATVILLMALLPRYGVTGAAIASTTAYWCSLVVMLLILRGNERRQSDRALHQPDPTEPDQRLVVTAPLSRSTAGGGR